MLHTECHRHAGVVTEILADELAAPAAGAGQHPTGLGPGVSDALSVAERGD